MNLRSKSRFQLALMWTGAMLLFPLLLAQGMRLRWIARRLPEAAAPDSGTCGAPADFSIVGVGDSVIAGVGVDRLEQALTAQVANAWYEQTGQGASWHAMGVNGECLSELLLRLTEDPPPPADLLLVSIGVNDVTRLTGMLKWQLQVTHLVSLLRQQRHRRILLLGVPPMEYFTALPVPLRQVLGIRAALLDLTLSQVGALIDQVIWLDGAAKMDASHLAEDGYHPNHEACREIAAEIVAVVRAREGL